MSFSIELFSDDPILLCTFHRDLNLGSELFALADQSNAALDAAPEPVYFISDTLAYTFSVPDLAAAANAATKGAKPPFFHPNVRKVIWVTDSKVMGLAARGFNSPTFGNVEIEVFPTLEEALAYCRSGA
jgi:hypothetical protein